MTPVRATLADLDDLVELQVRLFAEDAAVHERYADPTWATREGRADFEQLLASPTSLVLIARADSGEASGLLVGYLADSSPTRQPVTYAVLRSMYVCVDYRRQGLAAELTENFLQWAKDNNAAEAHVNHYAANAAAARLYESMGFAALSIQRTQIVSVARTP